MRTSMSNAKGELHVTHWLKRALKPLSSVQSPHNTPMRMNSKKERAMMKSI